MTSARALKGLSFSAVVAVAVAHLLLALAVALMDNFLPVTSEF